MPRVVDQFQGYLRELRMDDLKGSAGIVRLKEELLRRINASPDAEVAETIPVAASPGTAERILNQEEIDSLLGFDVNNDQMQDKSGVRAIINSALVSYERLPMLEIVFDRLVRYMTTSLRNFTSDNVEVSLDSITSIRFGDYLNSIRCPPSSRCSAPRSSTITVSSPSIPTSSIRSSTCCSAAAAAPPRCGSRAGRIRRSSAHSCSA